MFTCFCYAGSVEGMFYSCLAALVVYAAITDYVSYVIPGMVPVGILLLSVIRIGIGNGTLWDFVTGGLIGAGIFLLPYIVTKKKGIGGGDVKLMAAVGTILGPEAVVWASFLGCFLGVLWHLKEIKRGKTQSIIALGPYLAIGILLVVWFRRLC